MRGVRGESRLATDEKRHFCHFLIIERKNTKRGRHAIRSEIGHKELTQADMDDARIFWQATADRIHRDDILRVIVAYGPQVAELPRHGLFRAEQVNGLHVKPALAAHGHEVHLPVPEDAHRDLETLCEQVEVDDILHHLLDAAAQVEPAEQVAQAVVGEIKLVVLLEDALAVDVIPLDRYDDERPAEVAEISGRKHLGHLLAVRLHSVGDVPHGYELAGVVRDKYGQVLHKRDIADFLPCDDIAQHNGVVHPLQIIPDLAPVLHVVMAKAGETAHAEICTKALVRILQPMKTQEAPVGEAMDGDFDITPGKASAQLGREDVRIAACGHDLAAVLRIEAAQGVLVARDVLHLVDEQVVVAPFRQVGRGVPVQVVGRGDVLEGMKLLVDIYHVGRASVRLQPSLQLLEHVAFADPALADKDNHHPFAQMGDDVAEISRAFDYFHKQSILMQRYKIQMTKASADVENIKYTLIKQAKLNNSKHTLIYRSCFLIALLCFCAPRFSS